MWYPPSLYSIAVPPACISTALFIAGILSATVAPWTTLSYTAAHFITAFIAYIMLIAYIRTQQISYFFMLATFFLGFARASLHHAKSEQLYALRADHLDLIGTVIETQTRSQQLFMYQTTVAIRSVKPTSQVLWKPYSFLVTIYTRHKLPHTIGEIIFIPDAVFPQPLKTPTDQFFDQKKFEPSLFVPFLQTHTIYRPRYNIARTIATTRDKLVANLAHKMNASTFTLFATLFLGSKDVPKKEVAYYKTVFTHWGIAHYLARSGLHLTLFVISWSTIFMLVPLSFGIKQLLLVLLCLLYHCFSWHSISFLRALLLLLLYKLCIIMSLPINPLHLLSITCWIILFINPKHLFFLDFQLSFGLTYALALFNAIRSF